MVFRRTQPARRIAFPEFGGECIGEGNRACRDHCPSVSATLTTTAFDRGSLRWLGIGT